LRKIEIDARIEPADPRQWHQRVIDGAGKQHGAFGVEFQLKTRDIVDVIAEQGKPINQTVTGELRQGCQLVNIRRLARFDLRIERVTNVRARAFAKRRPRRRL
jgi:hypothetical protein